MNRVVQHNVPGHNQPDENVGTALLTCELLMLVTPPELPVAAHTIPALAHVARRGTMSAVVFANGLSAAEERQIQDWIRGVPGIRIVSNRERIAATRHTMRIGEWYETEAGRRELRVGYYESAPEVWERELPRLTADVVGIVDADFEILDGSFLTEMLTAFRLDPTLGFMSADYSPAERVYDSYSQEDCVLAERYHTWFCLYAADALRVSADFSYHERRESGTVFKFDHSAVLQATLAERGYHGAVLPASWRGAYVHYGRFAQNRTLFGRRLRIYRTLRIGRRNGWLHRHHIRLAAPVLRVLCAILYRALFLSRYDDERSRYRWE